MTLGSLWRKKVARDIDLQEMHGPLLHPPSSLPSGYSEESSSVSLSLSLHISMIKISLTIELEVLRPEEYDSVISTTIKQNKPFLPSVNLLLYFVTVTRIKQHSFS